MSFLPSAQVEWVSALDREPEAKKRPGPHTPINDATLTGHAGEIYCLLASNWADIGWQLEHVREPDDIRKAFEPLKDSNHRGFLTPFLRSTEEKATAADLCSTRKAWGKALTRQSEAEERHKRVLERSHLAETALSQASPEQHEAVESEAKKRKADLEEAKKALDQASKEVHSLEKRLRDQEAYYSRTELFNFIRSKKYACNPRNLAFAMTGLPYIGCGWSVSRCQKQKPNFIEIENYRLVEFIRRIWEAKPSTEERAIVERTATAIRALPKSDYLRTRLAENWVHLKRAIRTGMQEGQKPDIHPRRVPYIIASNFFKNLSQPKTAVDRLLTEKEQLNLV